MEASASAVPPIKGVLSLVGEVTDKTGALGTLVSTRSDNTVLAELVFPTASEALAVRE
jgi:hypothetical protein